MQIALLYVSNTQLLVILCNWFSIGINVCPKTAIVHPWMLLNINTYASSVIESSFALMKFMEVLMNDICRVVSTVDVNECIFCVNEQQKVYYTKIMYI